MPPFRSSLALIRAFPLLLPLGVLCLLTAGCSTTHQVPPDSPNARRAVTTAAQGKTAHVRLTDGRKLNLTRLYVGPDSTSGRTPEGTSRTVPTSTVQEVKFVERGTGFFQGVGLGGAAVLVPGVLRSQMADDELSRELGTAASFIMAVPSALLGGLIGVARGHRETYRFSRDSLATPPEKASAPYRRKPHPSQSVPAQ